MEEMYDMPMIILKKLYYEYKTDAVLISCTNKVIIKQQ